MVARWHHLRMKLKDYLSDKGISVRAFAREMSVAHTTVIKWTAGRALPEGRHMIRLEQVTKGKVKARDFIQSE